LTLVTFPSLLSRNRSALPVGRCCQVMPAPGSRFDGGRGAGGPGPAAALPPLAAPHALFAKRVGAGNPRDLGLRYGAARTGHVGLRCETSPRTGSRPAATRLRTTGSTRFANSAAGRGRYGQKCADRRVSPAGG